MSWNYSYAYGNGSAGLNYYQKSKVDFQSNYYQSLSLLNDQDPDIVLIQEIDFFAKKTHFIDQVKVLATNRYNSAYSLSWFCPYVPFPYFQIEDHFGQTISGGAVLSKYPILSNKTYKFPKKKQKFPLYHYFYPYRYVQIVELLINKKSVKVFNVHLEAYDVLERMEQTKKLIELIEIEKPAFIAGDFNALPIGSHKLKDFPYYPEDNYTNDKTIELLAENKDYYDASLLGEDESFKNTFPSNRPDRKLDYIFASKEYSKTHFEIIQSYISDHFPIKANFDIF